MEMKIETISMEMEAKKWMKPKKTFAFLLQIHAFNFLCSKLNGLNILRTHANKQTSHGSLDYLTIFFMHFYQNFKIDYHKFYLALCI